MDWVGQSHAVPFQADDANNSSGVDKPMTSWPKWIDTSPNKGINTLIVPYYGHIPCCVIMAISLVLQPENLTLLIN